VNAQLSTEYEWFDTFPIPKLLLGLTSDEIVIDEAWDLENSDIEVYESDWEHFLPLGITREHEAAFYICLYRDMRVLLHYASYYHEKFVNFCNDLYCSKWEWIIWEKGRRIP
jgi:hypothetical protein